MFSRTYRMLKAIARRSQIGAYLVWWFLFGPMYVVLESLIELFNTCMFIRLMALTVAWAIAVCIVIRMRSGED